MSPAGLAPNLELYGYGIINADGTIVTLSPSLSIVKGSAGGYIFVPKDATIPPGLFTALAIGNQNIPTVPTISRGIGPTPNSIQIVMYSTIAGVPTATNNAFDVFVYTLGNTKRTTSVP